MKKYGIFTILLCSLSFLGAHAEEQAPVTQSPFGMSVLVGLEAYPDSPYSSLSRGTGLAFIWDDLGYQNAAQLGHNYIRAHVTYYRERDSEQYDIDRFRNSGAVNVSFQRPFKALGEQDDYLLGVYARYDGHYNHQQLEEFETLAITGLSLNKRFSNVNNYDFGLIAGLAYSEEEKDDDWPREVMGHGTDVLGRSGLGYYLEWKNAYTFAHNGVQLSASLSRYDGRWNYDDGQFYVVDNLQFGIIVPLSDSKNLFRLTTEYISRDYELDLLGFEDVLYRVGIEYIHYF